ncbi:MAG: leucine-rich repeat domain-containing protein [Marinoscillum sp.]
MSDNEIKSLPSLSNLESVTSLDVSGNRLEFGSLESNVSIAGFTYLPQDSVGVAIEVLTQQGTNYEVDRTISGSSNSYSWFKVDLEDGSETSLDETGSSFTLPITDFTDEGAYYAQVTNAIVSGTLITHPVVVKVSSLERDSLALRRIYTKMNGSTWTGEASNWINETDFRDWEGVEFGTDPERVIGLELDNANLIGALPRDILDIQGLITINLSGNRISSLPDFSGLPNLTSLNLNGNNLEFDDLEKNMDVPGIVYQSQRLIGLSVRDTVRVGTNYTVKIQPGGTSNVYKWTLGNDLDTLVLTSETSSTIDIVGIDYTTMGRYTVAVTNPLVPGLTLSSRTTQVLATADLTFQALDLSNNAFTAGTGFAFRVTAPGNPYDTIQVIRGSDAGFVFDDLILGDYLIAVEPDDLVEFLPTYYPSTDLWTQATEFILRDDAVEALNMAQIPPPLPPDPLKAVISGTAESDFKDDTGEEEEDGRINARRKVKRAGCSVRRFTRGGRTNQDDGEFKLIAYVQSDDEGRFEFTDLDDGLYRFNIEYPGIPMDEDSYVEFELGGDGLESNRLVLQVTVTEGGISVEKIEELGFYRKYFRDLSVYPNPADNYLRISYAKLVSETVVVRLVDLDGHVLKEQEVAKGYDQSFNFDVTEFKSGVYLLNFIDSTVAGKKITTFKVFVKH